MTSGEAWLAIARVILAGGVAGSWEGLPIVEVFDEKQFYLDEFRGRTLLFSVPVEELKQEDDYEQLAAIVRELLTNDTRVLVFVGTPDADRGEQVLRRLQRRLGPLIFRDETIPLFPQRRARTAAFALWTPARSPHRRWRRRC